MATLLPEHTGTEAELSGAGRCGAFLSEERDVQVDLLQLCLRGHT